MTPAQKVSLDGGWAAGGGQWAQSGHAEASSGRGVRAKLPSSKKEEGPGVVGNTSRARAKTVAQSGPRAGRWHMATAMFAIKKAFMLDPFSAGLARSAPWMGKDGLFCPREWLSLPVVVPAEARTWLGRPVRVQTGLVRTRGESGAAVRRRPVWR